jgi:hypothetical protein
LVEDGGHGVKIVFRPFGVAPEGCRVHSVEGPEVGEGLWREAQEENWAFEGVHRVWATRGKVIASLVL